MKKYTSKKNSQEECLKIFLSKLFQQQFKNQKLPKFYSLFSFHDLSYFKDCILLEEGKNPKIFDFKESVLLVIRLLRLLI